MPNTKSPSFSVVVPLYNKRATVVRTLDSVFAQTFGDFELIVVDDGSTDGGDDLVQAHYDDARLRLHRQPNAGPAAARNQGLALSRGDYVTVLDADDTWRPEYLQTAVDVFTAHPECGAFTSSFGRVNRKVVEKSLQCAANACRLVKTPM